MEKVKNMTEETIKNMDFFIQLKLCAKPAARSTFIINKEFDGSLGRYVEVPERDTEFFTQLKASVNDHFRDYVAEGTSIKLTIEDTDLVVRFQPKHTVQDIIFKMSLMPQI